MDLFLFSTAPALIEPAVEGGVAAIVVDWERRGKAARQTGADTCISADDADDLARVRAATSAPVVCRLDRPGPWSPAQARLAAALGADELLVPMVRRPEDVEPVLAAVAAVAGGCRVGVLVETQEAVAAAARLAALPIARVYVGLNDLAIERRSASLFDALADGTVERVRAAVGDARFGVGGLTVPGGGRPIPVELLIGELCRLRADFTFLRRSFWRDAADGDVAAAVRSIHAAVAAARERDPARIATDRQALLAALAAGRVALAS
jgi:2-keto-3-deoxy-L-rhamnonate aldolase RhmA